jgi:murein DD-endopeptidase MepM/ murein hydrolase activator NlpD
VYEWPREPESPVGIDDTRFAEALTVLCGPRADRQVRAWYAPWILRAARELDADPFLLGALMFRASGCVQKRRGDRVGLTGLDPSLYSRDLRGGNYHFRAFDGKHWVERVLPLDRFPFEGDFISSPESNIYFAAGFLRAFREQQRGLRIAFTHPSEYRHYVSHFVWGDRVKSHREEDWILIDRRRLLEYYGALPPRPPITWRGFTLGCPLDGCPRVVTSTLGDARGDARVHKGNDFESTQGEPVRAVADGTVVFAGVDLPGRGAASKIPIWAQRNVDPESMGVGGLYACIDHGQSSTSEQLVSCYMHLDAATVVQGRQIKRGEQVGRVGTSGIKQSRPHLHFELHASDGVHAALEVLTGLAFGTPVLRPPTVLGGPTTDEAESE